MLKCRQMQDCYQRCTQFPPGNVTHCLCQALLSPSQHKLSMQTAAACAMCDCKQQQQQQHAQCGVANSSSTRTVWLQGCCQACTGSAGHLSAGRPALPQHPRQGLRHCVNGWWADLLCGGLDQHSHVAQDRCASNSALTAMPYVP